MIYSIEQIKRLRSQITPERWRYYEQQNGFAEWGQTDPPPVYIVEGPDYAVDCLHDNAIDHEPDAEFIASAPEIVDFMVAENERLRAALTAIRDREKVRNHSSLEWQTGYNISVSEASDIAEAALE